MNHRSSPRFPRALPVSLAGGVGLSSLAPAFQLAQATEPAAGIGVYVGATFGEGRARRTNFGIEARLTAMPDHPGDCESLDSFFSGGGVARIDFSGWDRGRLVLGAIGSRTLNFAQGTAELGLGVRLYEPGLDYVGGLRLSAAPFTVRLDRTFNQETWHLAAGLGVNREWVKGASEVTCVVGRPRRDPHGRAPLPDVLLLAEPRGNERDLAAGQVWLERARAEWASVAAFVDLAHQLEAVGAPPSLVMRALFAARQEAHHTALALKVVKACTGAESSLEGLALHRAPKPSFHEALCQLATESWTDGCVNEGVAAATAGLERLGATQEPARKALAIIGRDEAAHEALAWEVMAWCCREGGDDVKQALWTCADQTLSPVVQPRAETLEPWGVASVSCEEQVVNQVVDAAQRRLRGVLAAAG